MIEKVPPCENFHHDIANVLKSCDHFACLQPCHSIVKKLAIAEVSECSILSFGKTKENHG